MSITIRFGMGNELKTDQFPEGTSIGTVRQDARVRTVLGCGENTQARIGNVVQPDSNTVRDGDIITLETKAAQKAA